MDRQIKNLIQLDKARENQKSVIVPKSPCFSKPCPAAFVINYTGDLLLRLFESGMYIYVKQNHGGESLSTESKDPASSETRVAPSIFNLLGKGQKHE